ncbi:hypothetical protein BBJ29_007001 [Phytophthora kernoviae]|uniref:Uncharacterized protein n=1 Tax=Phytophthora kernoviae TaxID=325452 RepID=A0A3F2RN38_9STRA|nr:hypothetical protein BBJ29_007001 [Phytophthora kernoviae]RLN60901.1 hypothetical protein BBP00_00005696 [Phytophthora kernoviae]
MSDAKPDPVLTKQMQYIKVLEERNRIKKRLAAASKRNDRLHEREEAFVTAFNLRLTKCKSAPSTTLNFAGFGSGEGDEKGVDLRVRRAKWNRPQAPMNVAVEHHDGVRQFRLTTANDEDKDSEQKDADEYGDDEESYLEESFEEFEEEDVSEYSAQRPLMKELVIEEMEEEETVTTIPVQ